MADRKPWPVTASALEDSPTRIDPNRILDAIDNWKSKYSSEEPT